MLLKPSSRWTLSLMDFLGNLMLALSAGFAISSLRWGLPALQLPSWLASGVLLGLLFTDPVGSLRRGLHRQKFVTRFAVGMMMAALFHTLTFLVIDGRTGYELFLFLLPLLLLPLFMGPAAGTRPHAGTCDRAVNND